MNQLQATWYLLYCKAGQEARAQLHLANQAYVSYCPYICVERINKGKLRHKQEALFPNYLFVQLNEESNFNAVRSTRGVIDFVKVGRNYQVVADDIIAQIKSSEHAHSQPTIEQVYQPGMKVAVQQGAFQSLEAIYQRADGLERSVILVRLLNQQASLVVNNRDICLTC
ncbi:transcription/translation regulatory transformer protein RfaH [Agarivorans sp. QJM3NY_29]|uniref:transcription/translation regulatory transformer protein RfaH n=1 Tax=unclassified Agarivorans TaxID=2636026 RepID=UPI003D7E2BDB